MDSVAYLVLCHSVDEQLDILLDTLTEDPRSHVYVHLDEKTEVNGPIKGAEDKLLRNTFIADRRRVNWGGYSVVDATLRLLRTALQNQRHTHFVLISAACFPISSPKITNDKIENISTGLFSIWGPIDPDLRSNEGHGRYVVSKFHPYDWERINPKRGIFFERGWKLYKNLLGNLPLERRVSIEDLWKGSQFFVASRNVAEFLAQPHPELVRTLKYALGKRELIPT
ncbi:hypothetical protein AA0488_0716 [Kozakia baliensis NRIC 0488]|uniref:Glycosyl transferase n=2 Tax=Kozakia baliensis TaxID=153496 RepID=A0A1D8UTC7_9PROT|nr:beta-1,6-N-acetylglucosaminyltransferase [Kozakia baliensis]AOX16895.1 hypothetical protein A0U89_06840 [Kozakia baliensis]GBR25690.1 hypothetical protein AA0488_0716 [Kozakia baliensis NRIC 0488]